MPWGSPHQLLTSSWSLAAAKASFYTSNRGLLQPGTKVSARKSESPLPPGSVLLVVSAQREPAVSMGTAVGSAGPGVAPSRPSPASDPTGAGRIMGWGTSHRSGSLESAATLPCQTLEGPLGVPHRHRPGCAGHYDWPPSPAWPRALLLGFSLAQPRGCPAIRSCEGRP